MRDSIKLAIAAVACIVGVGGMLSGRPIARPPGILVDEDPQQAPTSAPNFELHDFELAPMAAYELDARVLSVERYRVDGGSRLSPIDFAVGWGPMSDSSVLDHFRITQGARFFTIYPDDEAIDIADALAASANMHLIPATDSVERQLKQVRSGNLVHLRGLLVNASRDDGFTWNTSLTRADTGAGACELFYVEEVAAR